MSSEYTRRAFLAAAGATGLAGCMDAVPVLGDQTPEPTETMTPPAADLSDWSEYDPEWASPTGAPTTDVRVETVVENLRVPWDFDFAPNGDLFLTERVGRILRIGGGTTVVAEPSGVVDASAVDHDSEQDWWAAGGEDGLLGVAVHPRYPDRPFVYAYYTYSDSDAESGLRNRVVRYDVEADDVAGSEEIVVDGIPANQYHSGGRIAFGPRGFLWVTCGDAGKPELAQDPGSLGGSILRVTTTGNPAPDNPGLAEPRVFTYGHRNPQGVSWLPDGRAVCTEHGEGGHDEVSLLSGGDNYGWPEARKQDEYEESEFHRPLLSTGGRTWAPSGCAFYTGDGVPSWRNRLLVGCLTGQKVSAVTLAREGSDLPPHDGDGAKLYDGWFDPALTAVSHSMFEDRFGRVRHVDQGPDGHPYAITSNRDGRSPDHFPTRSDDRLLKFAPAE